MPGATAFSDFGGGLDLRRDPALTAANILVVLKNAYITAGKKIKKRPCLTTVATLEAGTVGLKSFGGKLNTFTAQVSPPVTHANPLFQCWLTPHTNPAISMTRVIFAEMFNNIPYIVATYADGSTLHSYLDQGTHGIWIANTAFALNTFRRPTVFNGFMYKVTAVAGAGLSGAVEPVWPVAHAATVVDNNLTWTCFIPAIFDVNCPHSRPVAKVGQKIYAADGGDVAFCATGDPRDWTTAGDAGFLPTQTSAPGAETVTALGVYNSQLAVVYDDSLQVWEVNADPTLNALSKTSANVGTSFSETLTQISGDLVLLAAQGFRSLSVSTQSESMQESDVGSAIDALRSDIAVGDTCFAIFYPKLGQMWVLLPKGGVTKVYVYSHSKSVKVSAWQIFEWPFEIQAAAVLNNELYVRSGNFVFRVDDTVYSDITSVNPPLVSIQMFYQDSKTPGVLKQYFGFDGLSKGSPSIAFKWQQKNDDGTITEHQTTAIQVTGDMRPGWFTPMEMSATQVAPVITHQINEDFELSQLVLHYETLTPIH